jgi:Uma2 family endonuclease
MNFALTQLELPVRLRTARKWSDDELERFSRANEALQIERDANGELIVMSPVGTEGGSTELEICTELLLWARADGRGKVFGPSAGFTLSDTSVRAPDAAWVSLDRWNALTEQQRKHSFAPICPEFVIELRSQKDRLKELREKMQMWIANGAELAWLIDPIRKVVEVYRPGEEPEVHENPTSVQGSGPVRGFELVLSRIWS